MDTTPLRLFGDGKVESKAVSRLLNVSLQQMPCEEGNKYLSEKSGK